MEKGVRKEHRFDDLLALKATKTDLDLNTSALDGNPARKIRGLQTSCSGQRNARRGARSILDGERKLDVRDGEALLVGRVGRHRGGRGEGEARQRLLLRKKSASAAFEALALRLSSHDFA